MSVPYHPCIFFIGSGVWLSLPRLSYWSTTVLGAEPPWMKPTKGRRSLAGGRRRCSSLPYSSQLRHVGLPPVPLQMKCEHCTRKVGASSRGDRGGSQDHESMARVVLGRVYLALCYVGL